MPANREIQSFNGQNSVVTTLFHEDEPLGQNNDLSFKNRILSIVERTLAWFGHCLGIHHPLTYHRPISDFKIALYAPEVSQEQYDSYLQRTNWTKKASLGKAIIILIEDKHGLSSKEKLNKIFYEHTELFRDRAFFENYEFSDVIVFLQCYRNAVIDAEKNNLECNHAKLNKTIKLLDQLIQISKTLHYQDLNGEINFNNRHLWVDVILQCSGRLVNCELVKQGERPYCGVYSMCCILWKVSPEKMLAYTLKLTEILANNDPEKMSSYFPEGYDEHEILYPMVDDFFVCGVQKDRIDNGLEGTNFEHSTNFLSKMDICYDRLIYKHNQHLSLLQGDSTEYNRECIRILQDELNNKQVLYAAIDKILADTMIPMLQKNGSLMPCTELGHINNLIPQDKRDAYQKNYLAEEMQHCVVINAISSYDDSEADENTMVSVKFHTWGQTFRLNMPLNDFCDIFSFFEMFAIYESDEN